MKAELLALPSDMQAAFARLAERIIAMVDARHAAGLTQGQIATRLGTTQSAIARLENAHHLPSLEMVIRYAAAVGRKLNVQLTPVE